MEPRAVFPNDLEASSVRSNLTCNPAPPKSQTSLPDGATTSCPSARKDFATSLTPTSPEQHPLSPVPHQTVSSPSSPAGGFENPLTTVGEQDMADNDSGFSDTDSDTTSLDSRFRDHETLSLCDEGELLEREPRLAERAVEEGLDDSMLMILAAQAKQSLDSRMYFPLYIVTGQKPGGHLKKRKRSNMAD